MMKTTFVHQSMVRRCFASLVTAAVLLTSITIGSDPAHAATTKSCTTKLNGKSVPYYKADSMYVTRYTSKGQWRYKVTTSKKRTVEYRTSGGSQRFMRHHPEYIQLSQTYYKTTKVMYTDSADRPWPTSQATLKLVSHIQDGKLDQKPSCIIMF